MDLQLRGKRALVTGSTAGIGFAIAEALAREGATVVVNGRGEPRVREAVQKLAATGAEVHGLAADLGTAEGAEAAIAAHPDLDVLVNNVGIYEPKFEAIPDEDWRRIIEVNFMSGVRLCRHHLPRMKERGWGRIVFISSELAVNIPVEMVHYGVTKTMQVALARGLAESCAGTAVTVNSVLAGPTRSEGVGQVRRGPSQGPGRRPGPGRARLLRHRPPQLADATLRRPGRGGAHGRLPRQPALGRHQRGGAAGGRRGGALDLVRLDGRARGDISLRARQRGEACSSTGRG